MEDKVRVNLKGNLCKKLVNSYAYYSIRPPYKREGGKKFAKGK